MRRVYANQLFSVHSNTTWKEKKIALTVCASYCTHLIRWKAKKHRKNELMHANTHKHKYPCYSRRLLSHEFFNLSDYMKWETSHVQCVHLAWLCHHHSERGPFYLVLFRIESKNSASVRRSRTTHTLDTLLAVCPREEHNTPYLVARFLLTHHEDEKKYIHASTANTWKNVCA